MSEYERKGCGSHSCVIQKPIGVGTNGPCTCRDWKLKAEISRLQAENERLKKSLPTSVDGETILNGMTVYCIVGTYVDERKVISCANHAVYTFEPQRHGAGPGQCYRPESYIYAHRENALKALNGES